MTERLHVLATFDSREDLLDGMRRAASWIILDEASAIAALNRHRGETEQAPPDPQLTA